MKKHTLPQGVTLFHADCREALRSLPSDSIDAVPCDPPYELNFMGKGWDDTGIANDRTFWAEVFRVLKPGGHLAAFSASRTYHRMACAIEDAGFEIRDSLMWIYGTGFPKSQNVAKFIDAALGAESVAIGTKTYAGGHVQNSSVDKLAPPIGTFARAQDDRLEYAYTTPQAQEFDGFGTALKPAFEPIVLARKPLSEGTVAANVLRWRTGALNIDGCRIHTEGSEAKAYTVKRLKPGATLEATGGKWKQDDVEYQGMTKDGRWPANVVTDGSDEVVGMFPSTKNGVAGKRNAANGDVMKTGLGAYDTEWGGYGTPGASESAARFFYSAKASKADRAGSKHPTVKPIALMQWLARLITPPAGTILDPFAGSGTTGAAAVAEGFSAILCERENEYVADIKRRLGAPVVDLDAALRADNDARRLLAELFAA